MHIPPDAEISRDKLDKYLLVERDQDDKSAFLAQADYDLAHADELEEAIREQAAANEAVEQRRNEYGIYYLVAGELKGLGKVSLAVATIWEHRTADGRYRFVTLKPWKK